MMKNMNIGETKIEDLGKMASEVLDEMGDEIEEKTEELGAMGKRKLNDLGKKLEKMSD